MAIPLLDFPHVVYLDTNPARFANSFNSDSLRIGAER